QYNNLVRNLYSGDYNDEGRWNYSFFLGPTGNSGPFNYQPSTLKESVKDIRQFNFTSQTPNVYGGYSIYKYVLIQCTENISQNWVAIYRSSNTTPNWIIYRLSDVMLMKAEALVQLNSSNDDLKQALNLVNTTYLRSNMTADSLKFNNYPDKGAMQDLVLRERQRELMFEGKRWYDLMRLVRRNNDAGAIIRYVGSKLKDDLQIKKMSVMDALYMPIEQSQIDINPSLIQNPFYEDTNLPTTN
ncbi:MAG: RagB/SusD family nutrient uptake outer membrane protein, partial [Paludibacter sp.]